MAIDIEELIELVFHPSELVETQQKSLFSHMHQLEYLLIPELLERLIDRLQLEQETSRIAYPNRLQIVLTHTGQLIRRERFAWDLEDRQPEEPIAADQIAELYALIPVEPPQLSALLLQWLAIQNSYEDLVMLAELMVVRPPNDWQSVGLAISPLFQRTEWPVDALFPRILDAIKHPSVAASILDLSNFVARQDRNSPHPATGRNAELLTLLGAVVQRLAQLEEDPNRFGNNVNQVQKVLQESIALTVSLCDTMGLLGDAVAIPKLNQALELSHRRVQTEAAGALALLGDAHGKQTLIELAAEPVARLRVLAYADELGILDSIPEERTTPASRAESELALWLAQPAQFGIAPQEIELLDDRLQYWPGFEDRQHCFLFRFHYRLQQGSYSNVGIVGPMVHTFAADLADLPIDDIYAAFAGWQAEHDEIYEVPTKHWNSAQQIEAKRLQKSLTDAEHESIQPLALGFFVGERALIAKTVRGPVEGVAITDGTELLWFPTSSRIRPLGPSEAYSIYKGRKFLRTFNT